MSSFSYNFLVFGGKANYCKKSPLKSLELQPRQMWCRTAVFETSKFWISNYCNACNTMFNSLTAWKSFINREVHLFLYFIKNCIKYLRSLPTDHRRLSIRILLCFQILDSWARLSTFKVFSKTVKYGQITVTQWYAGFSLLLIHKTFIPWYIAAVCFNSVERTKKGWKRINWKQDFLSVSTLNLILCFLQQST